MSTSTNAEKFHGRFLRALKEQWQADIKLKPGDDEIPILAHKLILAGGSKVFRDMFGSVDCDTSKEETITLAELKREELEAFLEFLYKGTLPDVKLKQHVRSLYLAADKYDIPHLQDLCRSHLISSLYPSNALDVIELSVTYSDRGLQDVVFGFVVQHIDDIVTNSNFKAFVERNPSLTVDILEESLQKSKMFRNAQLSFSVTRSNNSVHIDGVYHNLKVGKYYMLS